MNLVNELCKQRTKTSLDFLMQFIVSVMTEYQVCSSAHMAQLESRSTSLMILASNVFSLCTILCTNFQALGAIKILKIATHWKG